MKVFSAHTTRRGFVMLYAVLVASLLLSIGLAIFEIIFKETSFAIVTRDSNKALYAADTGMDCALYWDAQYQGSDNFGIGSIFATSTDSTQVPSAAGIAECENQDIINAGQPPALEQPQYPECAGHSGTGWCLLMQDSSTATTTFSVGLPGGACSVISIGKAASVSVSGAVSTYIISRGFNTCIAGTPNRIERAIEAHY